MWWIDKTTQWLYLEASVGGYQICELLAPDLKKWTETDILNWLAVHYGRLYKTDAKVVYKLSLIEYTLED